MPSSYPAREHEPCRGEVVGNNAEDRGDLGDRSPLRVHACVQHDDDDVADPEGQALALVRRRDRESNHEEPTHPAEQEEAKPQEIRRDGVRQPGVAVVHPPDHREHHDHLQRRLRAAARHENARQLRDREDEDEVEEELERRDTRAAVDQLGHRAIIVESSAGGGAAGQNGGEGSGLECCRGFATVET